MTLDAVDDAAVAPPAAAGGLESGITSSFFPTFSTSLFERSKTFGCGREEELFVNDPSEACSTGVFFKIQFEVSTWTFSILLVALDLPARLVLSLVLL